MYKVKVQGLDLLTTPNHRMYVSTNLLYGKTERAYEFKTAEEIYHQKARYKKTAIYNKPDLDFKLPPVTYYTGGGIVKNKGNERTVNTDAFLKFIGFWIAEGIVCMTEFENSEDFVTGSSRYNVNLYQKKEEGLLYIKQLLKDLDLKATCFTSTPTEDNNASGATMFTINDKQLATFLKPYSVGARQKFLPEFVWDLSPRQCKLLLEGLIMGDESIKSDGTRHYYTSSIRLANDVSRLAVHAGYTFSMWEDKTPSRTTTIRKIRGREIGSFNPLYVVNIIEKKTEPWVNYYKKDEKFVDSYVPYSGTVHCLTVPEGVFYVQRNGFPVWTGNSSLQGQA